MISLIAQKTYTFGGLKLRPGVDFSASPKDARVLVAVGRAAYAPGAEPVKKPKPQVKPKTKPQVKPKGR